MRKRLPYFFFAIILFLVKTDLIKAQLSGVYTIDQNTIVSTTNFTSLTSFANALNINGASGAVTVNIVANSGPYVEQPSFIQAFGVTATNSVLINGNNNTLTVNNTSNVQPWVLNLDGADYMTFRKLNIIGTGSNVYGIMLNNAANFNHFDSLNVTVPANSNSSNYIPFVISGSNTTHTVQGNGGNFNKLGYCNLNNGYYGAIFNGSSNSASTSNTIINCSINNFYNSGVFSSYQAFLNIKGCVIERPLSTVLGSSYGIYLYYNQSATIDANRLRYLGGSAQSNTSTVIGIYCYYNSSESTQNLAQNIIKNNIVSDILSNGHIYGFYGYRMGGMMLHNTLVLNNNNYNNNLTHVYGYYGYYSSISPLNFKNNLVYMALGGTGPRYPVYFLSSTNSTIGLSTDYNNYYANNAGNTNYAMNGTVTIASSLAGLQSLGYELNSIALDPQFLGSNNHNKYLPTHPLFDNKGTTVGITLDINNQTRGVIPDIGAIETQSNLCTNATPIHAVVTPTYMLCPGATVNIPFSGTYTSAGLSFNWQTSTTSSLGPWTAISGATNQAYTANNVVQNTWYQAVVNCSTNANNYTVIPGQLLIAGTTTSLVPYLEDFEGLSVNNQLPNCSWLASSQGSNCLTYTASQTQNRIPHNGSRFAAFHYNPGGQHYFYTNGIFLSPGITYSASVWFTTEQNSYTNFTDLSILYGTTQSPTGQVLIASTNGPAASPIYTSLSNTFQVSNSGFYYIAVRATVNTTAMAQYLSFDDLSIIIPCQLNSPVLSIISSTNQVCSGGAVTYTASGANTYNWGNGNTGSIITYTPLNTSTLTLIGTNGLGCIANDSVSIIVHPLPNITTSVSSQTICSGQSTTLTASGAINYTWTSGLGQMMGSQIVVSPITNTTFTLTGTDNNGCSNTVNGNVVLNVHPTSIINISATNKFICNGQSTTLTASGALNYTWTSFISQMQGSQVVLFPNANVTYTITGVDTNSCLSHTTISLFVNECLGLNKLNSDFVIKVAPNPTDGVFSIEVENEIINQIEISNLSGMVLFQIENQSHKVDLSLIELRPGLYIVTVKTDTKCERVKILKQ